MIRPERRAHLLTLLIAAAIALALAACGSSSSSTLPSTSTVATVKAKPAGVNPSASAQMVCGPEAQKDLRDSLGVAPTLVTPPTWVDHVYSCSYVYPNGALTVSVKELDSASQTASYFQALRTRLGRRSGKIPVGQGAFTTDNGSFVVRKDWKVLLVDVSKLPPKFGQPPITPADVGVATGVTIMGCWTGA